MQALNLEYVKALIRHWWALMSCAIFTGIGVYAAWQNKGNSWIVRASGIAAVLFFLLASYLAWNDEHRKLQEETANREVPKLYLEYSLSQAAHFMMFSGLIVRNVGRKTAFKIVLTCGDAAKVRLHFRDMPIQEIDPDKGESIATLTEYLNDNGLWYPVGGTHGQQVQSCFERLNDEGVEETIPVVIAYADYEGREYSTRCVIKRDGTCFLTRRIWCELV